MLCLILLIFLVKYNNWWSEIPTSVTPFWQSFSEDENEQRERKIEEAEIPDEDFKEGKENWASHFSKEKCTSQIEEKVWEADRDITEESEWVKEEGK